MNIKGRFGILSVSVPPSLSGQAIILYRLLHNLPQEKIVVISSGMMDNIKSTEKLKCKYFRLPQLFGKKTNMVGKYFFPLLFVVTILETFFRAYKIIRIIKSENLTKFIVCTGNIHDLPAASIACSFTNIPLISYLFDDYYNQWKGGYKILAQIFEKHTLNKSSSIIVPNEYMASEIEKRHAIKPSIIRNAVDIENVTPIYEPKTLIKFLFAGSVYYANYDALFGFVKVLNNSNISYCLNIFTSQPVNKTSYKYYLSDKNIIIREHLTNSRMKSQYIDFDILLLPLSLLNENSKILKTSAPGKLGEYLSSGKPLLAIVPEDCFVDWYLRKHNCGFVVNNLENLQSTIHEIMDNKKNTFTIINNAIIRAKMDFNILKESEKFSKILCS